MNLLHQRVKVDDVLGDVGGVDDLDRIGFEEGHETTVRDDVDLRTGEDVDADVSRLPDIAAAEVDFHPPSRRDLSQKAP